MKYFIFLIATTVMFSACKKDKYTTEPQISFKSVNPNATSIAIGSVIPVITFGITDAEGDIGFKKDVDTAFIYIKNNLTGKSDSLAFPDLNTASKSNFKADVNVSIETVLQCKSLPNGSEHTDTLYFDIYVKDFAGNKSNVITTGEPIYFLCR
ncbi:MAG: hypothetical protein ABIY51_15160 [Ferruginibacter sp.]